MQPKYLLRKEVKSLLKAIKEPVDFRLHLPFFRVSLISIFEYTINVKC